MWSDRHVLINIRINYLFSTIRFIRISIRICDLFYWFDTVYFAYDVSNERHIYTIAFGKHNDKKTTALMYGCTLGRVRNQASSSWNTNIDKIAGELKKKWKQCRISHFWHYLTNIIVYAIISIVLCANGLLKYYSLLYMVVFHGNI